MEVIRGDVFFAELDPVIGSEQGGTRPVVVIQNDIGNKFSPTIVAAITSKDNKHSLPTHVRVQASNGGLFLNSVVMLEQIRTIDKTRLRSKIGHLDEDIMQKIEDAMQISLGIKNIKEKNDEH